MNIINRIEKLMEEKGLTKKDLIKMTNIKKSTFYYLFSDTVNEDKVSLETIRPIAKALNTTMDYLIYGEESEKPVSNLTGLKLELALSKAGLTFDDLNGLSEEQADLIAAMLKNFLKNKAND